MLYKFSGLAMIMILFSGCSTRQQDNAAQNFSFTMNFTYPGSPEQVYDELTGDISDWWDHTFSGNPDSLYIEAWPGGGFYEIFDDSGDGVLHARITYARRGELLRMEGPLGLAGYALLLVCTYRLQEDDENGTRLTLEVNGSGQYPEDSPELIKSVWEHFLWEQFRPHMEEALR